MNNSFTVLFLVLGLSNYEVYIIRCVCVCLLVLTTRQIAIPYMM